MPLKAVHPIQKPHVNLVQRQHPLLWTRRHLGLTINQYYFLEEMVAMLRSENVKVHPGCYQQQVCKKVFVMVWSCISALGKSLLYFCDGSIYSRVSEHHILLFKNIFSSDVHPTRHHFLHTLQRHGCGKRRFGHWTGPLAVPHRVPLICHIEMVRRIYILSCLLNFS